jgi:hypothetical protein
MLCPVDWAAVFFALKRLRSLNLYKRCGTKKDRIPHGGVRAASRHGSPVPLATVTFCCAATIDGASADLHGREVDQVTAFLG